MRSKRKSCRGVTVAEMLIAVLLLALLTAGGAAAASAVMAVHAHMTDVAHAEILASTVAEAVTNEIRLGKTIAVTDDAGAAVADGAAGTRLKLRSVRFGADTVLRLDGGHLVADVTDSAAATPTTRTVQVLADTVYNGLELGALTYTPVADGRSIPLPDDTATAGRPAYTVSITVQTAQGRELWQGSVSAAPLQQP